MKKKEFIARLQREVEAHVGRKVLFPAAFPQLVHLLASTFKTKDELQASNRHLRQLLGAQSAYVQVLEEGFLEEGLCKNPSKGVGVTPEVKSESDSEPETESDSDGFPTMEVLLPKGWTIKLEVDSDTGLALAYRIWTERHYLVASMTPVLCHHAKGVRPPSLTWVFKLIGTRVAAQERAKRNHVFPVTYKDVGLNDWITNKLKAWLGSKHPDLVWEPVVVEAATPALMPESLQRGVDVNEQESV